jgi:hypothetical protein
MSIPSLRLRGELSGSGWECPAGVTSRVAYGVASS